MAAGSPFTLVPNEVITLEPEYHNIITQSESMKKEYYSMTSNSIQKYDLKFTAVTNADRDTLLTHYSDQYGGYHNFSWQSVPSYIGSGANITGRWVDGSLRMKIKAGTYWECLITFEKEVA